MCGIFLHRFFLLRSYLNRVGLNRLFLIWFFQFRRTPDTVRHLVNHVLAVTQAAFVVSHSVTLKVASGFQLFQPGKNTIHTSLEIVAIPLTE